jgi:hypothetical protein
MKDFTQYSSIDEVVQDLIMDGLIPRNRKLQVAFPGVRPKTRDYHVNRIKTEIVRELVRTKEALVPSPSRARLYRVVRGDNYPMEFNTAIDQLIEEKKIVAQVFQTKGRPYTHYNLFEF